MTNPRLHWPVMSSRQVNDVAHPLWGLASHIAKSRQEMSVSVLFLTTIPSHIRLLRSLDTVYLDKELLKKQILRKIRV